MLARTKAEGVVPTHVNLSYGHRLPKWPLPIEADEQVGTDERTVHSFGALSKAITKVYWTIDLNFARMFPPADWDFGAIPRRRREEALTVQGIMGSRAATLGLSSGQHNFDVQNAFPSVEHHTIHRMFFPDAPSHYYLDLFPHHARHIVTPDVDTERDTMTLEDKLAHTRELHDIRNDITNYHADLAGRFIWIRKLRDRLQGFPQVTTNTGPKLRITDGPLDVTALFPAGSRYTEQQILAIYLSLQTLCEHKCMLPASDGERLCLQPNSGVPQGLTNATDVFNEATKKPTRTS